MIRLEHFLWFPKEGTGYDEEASAKSRGVNPNHYVNWFGEWLPLILRYNEKEAYMMFNRSHSPYMLFTRVSHQLDEHGREARGQHTVLIPEELLKQERLSLFEVKDAVSRFDEKYENPEGIIDKLRVPEKEGEGFEHMDSIRVFLTKSALKKLSYTLIKNERNKVMVRCPSSEVSERFQIMVYLMKLFNLDFDVRPDISLTSSKPRDEYIDLFNIAVTPRKFIPYKHKEEWSIIDWEESEFYKGKPKHKKLKKIFDRIEEDYKVDVSVFIEDGSVGQEHHEKKESPESKVSVEGTEEKSDDKHQKLKERPKSEAPVMQKERSKEPREKEPEILQDKESPPETEGSPAKEEAEDGHKEARKLLNEATKKYGSTDFSKLRDYIDSPNFDLEIFKVKLENFKKKGKKISKEKKEKRIIENLEKAKDRDTILKEDYFELKERVEEEEDLSFFEEEFNRIKKKRKLYLLIEEICKGFGVSDEIREKIVKHGKKNIDIPSDKLDAEKTKKELREIKERIVDYFQKKEEDGKKDRINNVEDLVENYSTVDFSDVAGMSGLKRRLSMAVESPIEDYEIYKESTGKPPENSGILLYGAPGVGKTFMARAAAGEYQLEYDLSVVNVPIETIYGLHWSKQVERLVDIFELSERLAPSMVIWDEFDTYAADPKLTGRKYDEKKTTTFKQKFEGVIKSEDIVMHIATSNYPWKLELPLIRPGRLGEIIYVPPPDKTARREILKIHASDAKIESIDFDKLAELTENATTANLKNIVKVATERPIEEWLESGKKGKPRPCNMDDFLYSIENENLSQYESWLKEAKRELERPKLRSKADLFPEIFEEYDSVVGT